MKTRLSDRFLPSNSQWFGSVPSHWSRVRMASLFKEVDRPSDPRLPVLSVSIHGGVSDKQLADEDRDRVVNLSDDRTKYQRVKKNDLVYNMMRAWQGAFGTVSVDGLVSPAYVVAEPKTDNFRTKYIELLLQTSSGTEEVRRFSKGIADFRMRLYWDHFRSIVICLPPIEEQDLILEHIAAETYQIDRLIHKKRRFIELLTEKRASLISHCVTEGIRSNASIRDKKEKWAIRVPAHWAPTRLRFIADIYNSNVDKKTREEDISVALCNYVDVYRNNYITFDIDFMKSTASKAEIELFELRKNDIIITKDSEDPFDIGIPAFVKENMPGVICGYHLSVIRVRDAKMAPFVFYSIQSHQTKAKLCIETPGVTRYGLDQNTIKDIVVYIPPDTEATEIVDHIKSEHKRIDDLISKIDRSIALLKERRRAVLNDALTGKINMRVTINHREDAAA